MVFRSRRQSRLTVATMFLEYGVSILKTHAQLDPGDQNLLKSWGQAAAGLLRTGGGSRCGRRNTVAVGKRRASRGTVLRGLETSVTRRCQLVVTSWERQRARRHEVLGLVGIARVGLNSLHGCDC